MTSTRSAMSATTPRSWVTKITPLSLSLLSCLISFRICAWMVTSSAVVGSSAISTPGDSDSAIAIITRCRIPPENSCGEAGRPGDRAGDPHPSHRVAPPFQRLGLGALLVRQDLLGDLVSYPLHRVE